MTDNHYLKDRIKIKIKEFKTRIESGEDIDDVFADMNDHIADQLEQHIRREDQNRNKHVHRLQVNNQCKECGAPLCQHYSHNLRGCMMDRNHNGPHYNPNSTDKLTWTDAEGEYVRSHTDWVNLVDQLGKPKN